MLAWRVGLHVERDEAASRSRASSARSASDECSVRGEPAAGVHIQKNASLAPFGTVQRNRPILLHGGHGRQQAIGLRSLLHKALARCGATADVVAHALNGGNGFLKGGARLLELLQLHIGASFNVIGVVQLLKHAPTPAEVRCILSMPQALRIVLEIEIGFRHIADGLSEAFLILHVGPDIAAFLKAI